LSPLAAGEDRSTPLLRRRIQLRFRHLPKALAGQEEPVHQLRVAGRRLRVALPILARKPGGRRVLRTLRGLRRVVQAAGMGRDLDVCVALFEVEAGEVASRDREARALRSRLRAARNRSHHQMAESLLDLHLAQLRRDLRKIVARGADDLFPVLGRFRLARDEGGAALLQALEELGSRFAPIELHAIRRGVRRLRYVAELGAELVRDEASEAAGNLKKLQEQLGEIHDGFILAQWFGRRALGPAPLHAAARRFEEQFLELSRSRHQLFLEQEPVARLRKSLELMGRHVSAA
jgi:CHAD domain-containing protein